ncbi:DUF3298 and DUF4163 domain-containing protein [Zhouia spongiae]|uniref:DUF3298 and DUF4163 domain-containing protein n=1 Tax=Zhouia spongiae TaxID=2202721 RepID=A0ABY3YNR5_9FLAO|nr:DUF3298 and DUF4163 domain-containing protein [Zhouia spongiae]UNY99466.1 DUF3298 and DUF4163 domain-containing protein [Zhouia spongiae]
MKKYNLLLLTIFAVISCNKDGFELQQQTITSEPCDTCAKVSITIPKANGNAVADSINKHLNEYAIQVLNYTEEHSSESIEQEVDKFVAEYKKTKNDFPDMAAVWEATIKGEIPYRSENVISIQLDSYVYTGGAHGYGAISYINIDAKTGMLLESRDLFSDFDNFEELVEEKFRSTHNIPENENINSTGFMFDNDVFRLPQNIGYTHEGIVLIYNPYDIAAYAEGMITIQIPFEELQQNLILK